MGCIKLSILDEQYKNAGIRLSSQREDLTPIFCTKNVRSYSFNGKELDEESGLLYYEARYYGDGTFRSRDKLFEKFFNWSPYAYCKNNPVIYIDPSGMSATVYITGDEDAAQAAAGTLSTENITVTRDNDRNSKTFGKLSVTGEAKTEDEQKLVDAINSDKVQVNLRAEYSDIIERDADGTPISGTEMGGAFMGNELYYSRRTWAPGYNANKPCFAEAEQFISFEALDRHFHSSDFGKVITHEITEAYFGGLISINWNKKAYPAYVSPGSTMGSGNRIYEAAHGRASTCPKPYR